MRADRRHVVLSHVDRCPDVGYHRALLQTGVRVEFDSANCLMIGNPAALFSFNVVP